MSMFKDKSVIKEETSGFGTKFVFFSHRFDGTSPLHLFVSVFVFTVLIHFSVYLFNQYLYTPAVSNISHSSMFRFPLEVIFGFWLGYAFFAKSKIKNEVDLFKNNLTFKSKFKETTLQIESIERIGFNVLSESKPLDLNFNAFYLYAESKGKKYKLHKGYVTREQADYIVSRINL